MGVIEAARRYPLRGLLACATGFAALLVLAYWVPPFPHWDRELLLAVRAAPGTVSNEIAAVIEGFVSPLAQVGWTVLAAALAIWLGRPRRAVFAVAEVAGTAIVVQLLKTALERHRFHPAADDPFRWHPIAKSFPSGNSAGALAIALAFLVVVPPRWRTTAAAAGAAFTLLVCAALLVLDWHFPSDILGGWLVALGWFFALSAYFGRDRVD